MFRVEYCGCSCALQRPDYEGRETCGRGTDCTGRSARPEMPHRLSLRLVRQWGLSDFSVRTVYPGRRGKSSAGPGCAKIFLFSSQNVRPAVAVVQIDPESGERTVFYNVTGYRYAKPCDIPADIAERSRLFLVDGYEPEGAVQLLKLARRANRPSVLDLESGPPEILNEMLALGTDAILPLATAQNLSGCDSPERVLENLRGRTDAALVVTDGANGSWANAEGSLLHQPAFTVKAKDTTGCGDAFHAAYAVGLLEGWDLKERLEFAAYVSSRVALELGGRSGIPTMEHFREADLSFFLRSSEESNRELDEARFIKR